MNENGIARAALIVSGIAHLVSVAGLVLWLLLIVLATLGTAFAGAVPLAGLGFVAVVALGVPTALVLWLGLAQIGQAIRLGNAETARAAAGGARVSSVLSILTILYGNAVSFVCGIIVLATLNS